MSEQNSFDALLPPAMAAKAEDIGVKKAGLKGIDLFLLAVLAGAFIAIGAIFATIVSSGGMVLSNPEEVTALTAPLPYGINRLLAGIVFSTGLILVIVGGAELFTGNAMITMAFASRKISFWQLIRNWGIVYVGNFVGAVLTAIIVFLGKQYRFGSGVVGLTMLNIGETKTTLSFIQAISLGVLCNALVCMAIWMCYSSRTTTDKILSIIPPISCFVAAGFEHSVANMYFIPEALLVKYWSDPTFFQAVGKSGADFPHLTMENFLIANLLPVTIGNIIGGTVMVALVYWFVYTRKQK